MNAFDPLSHTRTASVTDYLNNQEVTSAKILARCFPAVLCCARQLSSTFNHLQIVFSETA